MERYELHEHKEHGKIGLEGYKGHKCHLLSQHHKPVLGKTDLLHSKYRLVKY